jgi:hypothetical protein
MEQFVYLALDVPLFRGARGVLIDLRYTKYDIRTPNVDFECLSQQKSVQDVLLKCAVTERSEFLILPYMTYMV